MQDPCKVNQYIACYDQACCDCSQFVKKQLFCIQSIVMVLIHMKRMFWWFWFHSKVRLQNKHSSRSRSGVSCRIFSSCWIIIAVLQWKYWSYIKVLLLLITLGWCSKNCSWLNTAHLPLKHIINIFLPRSVDICCKLASSLNFFWMNVHQYSNFRDLHSTEEIEHG